MIGDELKDFTGLAASQPALAFAMLVFLLSLGGIPLTAGFMGKLWLFGAALDAGYVGLAVVGVLNSALSLYYYARIVVLMWSEDEDQVAPAVHPSPGLVAAVAVAAVGTCAGRLSALPVRSGRNVSGGPGCGRALRTGASASARRGPHTRAANDTALYHAPPADPGRKPRGSVRTSGRSAPSGFSFVLAIVLGVWAGWRWTGGSAPAPGRSSCSSSSAWRPAS